MILNLGPYSIFQLRKITTSTIPAFEQSTIFVKNSLEDKVKSFKKKAKPEKEDA